MGSAGYIAEVGGEVRDREGLDRLVPSVYDELRLLARRQLRRGRRSPTLDTTALVHEAYLKLARGDAAWLDRTHFVAVAAVAMRHILVDRARRRAATKRGGDAIRVTLDDGEPLADRRAVEVLALDEALTALGALNERLARLVELRYFGGLTDEETAAALQTSERTVRREWRKARAFLYRALQAPSPA